MNLCFNVETLTKSLDCKNEIEFEKCEIEKSENPNDPKFDYFKRKILDHLAELEKTENKTISKSMDLTEWIQKANFPVGTIRTWKGQRFKKTAPNKWVRVYDKESRGAKMALAALRRKCAECKDSQELLQLVLANKERFVDGNGKPLAFMQEFSAYVSGLNDKHEGGKDVSKPTETPQNFSLDDIKGNKTVKTLPEVERVLRQIAEKYGTGVEGDKKAIDFMAYNLDGGIVGKLGSEFMRKYGSMSYTTVMKKLLGQKVATLDENYADEYANIEEEKGRQRAKEAPEATKNDGAKNALNNAEKVKFVNKLSGEVYHDYETDPTKFAAYAKDGKATGLVMTQDIADIINSHGEASVLDWKDAVAADIHAKYPKIRESYVKENITAIRMGYRNGNKEKVMILSEQKEEPKTDDKPQSDNGKKSGIDAIRSKYQSSKSIDGDEDEIYVGKETITGKWKLVEADAPSASHDELTFHKTEGFPEAENGGTVNDRDYEHDAQAQEAVLDMSADFDGRALGFDSPIVVTQDGVVTSGNNRTMSSKLAARKGTDTKYIEALKKRAKKFGFTADDVAQFKHPRVVFETEHKGNYTTDEFAKYNESGKKAKSPIEKAVEVSKRMKAETIESIAGNISEFDTMGELYADKKASLDIFSTLINSNIIQKTDLSQYYTDGGITETGKEFLETVLVGSVINETNIRALNGAKSVRQKLVRAIVPLVENKGMKGYSINSELNEAVSIAIEVAGEKSKKDPAFRSVEEYSQLQDMFKKIDPVAVELAKKLDGRTQKEFAEFMMEMNGGLRPAANGEVDIFLGGVESKEEIVSRVLKIKDTVKKALDKFFGIFGATA